MNTQIHEEWGKDSTQKLKATSLDVTSFSFPATIDIHPTTFFFLWVQLENIYNEGTSVLSDYFAYLGVVKAGIDFPAQLALVYFIWKIRLSELNWSF